MEPITWKNTIHDSVRGFGNISDFAQTAHTLGYSYMCWNDRIYKVSGETEQVITWTDTHFTINDVGVESKPRHIVVAGRGKSGEPVLESFKVRYNKGHETEGIHYDMAIEMAERDGMEAPFICFDEAEYDEIFVVADRLNNLK